MDNFEEFQREVIAEIKSNPHLYPGICRRMVRKIEELRANVKELEKTIPCTHPDCLSARAVQAAGEEVEKLRAEVERVTAEREEARERSDGLWMLLDDIDTAGDMFKPDKTPYFEHVERIHKRRHSANQRINELCKTVREEAFAQAAWAVDSLAATWDAGGDYANGKLHGAEAAVDAIRGLA